MPHMPAYPLIALGILVGLIILGKRMWPTRCVKLNFGEKQAASTLLAMFGAAALVVGPAIGAIIGLGVGVAGAIGSATHDLTPMIYMPFVYAIYGLMAGAGLWLAFFAVVVVLF